MAPVACALALVVAGLAYWTAPGSGSTSSVVSSLTAPAPSATNPSSGTAHVAWSAVTLDPAVPSVDAEVTFTVERKPSSGSTWVFVCGTGTTPKPYNVLSCDDTPPAGGAYDYRVTARLRTWTSAGVASVTVPGRHERADLHDRLPVRGRVQRGELERGLHELHLRDGERHRRKQPAEGGGQHSPGVGQLLERERIRQREPGLEPRGGHLELDVRIRRCELPGGRLVHGLVEGDRQRAERPVSGHDADVRDRHDPAVRSTAAAIAATTGTSPAGFVKQGGGYAVYADVTDVNGVSSVAANVSSITTGQTALALSTCASGCTVAGHTYLYKSATQTASNPLTEGSKGYTVTATDVVSNATPLRASPSSSTTPVRRSRR